LSLRAPEIPEEVSQIAQKAMAKRREDRYSSAFEFGANLRAAAERYRRTAPAHVRLKMQTRTEPLGEDFHEYARRLRDAKAAAEAQQAAVGRPSSPNPWPHPAQAHPTALYP